MSVVMQESASNQCSSLREATPELLKPMPATYARTMAAAASTTAALEGGAGPRLDMARRVGVPVARSIDLGLDLGAGDDAVMRRRSHLWARPGDLDTDLGLLCRVWLW